MRKQAIFNVTNDNNNSTTFQSVDIDLTSNPATGTYANDIARVVRTPWGISSGDVCQVQRIELYKSVPALSLKGIMDLLFQVQWLLYPVVLKVKQFI